MKKFQIYNIFVFYLKIFLRYKINICFIIYYPQTGDEMSKRSKFVMVTWVGPNVSVMKKAKMSTDKALMKDIIQVIK